MTVHGARRALALLLFINLFNYVDRQVLAAVVPSIERSFFGPGGGAHSALLDALQEWCRTHLGFRPELALIGVLSMAFMVVYMIGAPVFGRLAERHSRWLLVGIGVICWSLASGASGLATTFIALLLTRCLVGVGEAAYGPVAPTILSDLYPVADRGRVLAWFYMAIPVGSALGYVLGGAVAGSAIGERGARCSGSTPRAGAGRSSSSFRRGSSSGPGRSSCGSARAGVPTASRTPRRAGSAGATTCVLLRTPSYVLCTLGMTAMTFAIGGIAFWMPYYLCDSGPARPRRRRSIFGAITVRRRSGGDPARRHRRRPAPPPLPRLLLPRLRRRDARRLPVHAR